MFDEIEIGQWYQNDMGQSFEVVALDPNDETIEIQYFDGAVEELEFDIWRQMAPQAIEPPEDVSGALGDEESENLGLNDDGVAQPEEWNSVVNTIEPEE